MVRATESSYLSHAALRDSGRW